MDESELLSLKNHIAKINLESETAYEEIFCAFTQGFNMPIIFIPLKKGSICYRCRNNKDKKDYENFSDLSYPDKKFILNYSRANKPGQQVFYCSDSFGTTLTELLPKWSKDFEIGESFTVTISEWNFMNEITIACIPDFDNARLMKLLNNKIDFESDAALMKYWEFINTFFRAQGLNQPNVYKFTSAFCNALLSNTQVMGEKVNGIMYTSIQDLTLQGWNLAISPKFVEKNLKLKKVLKLILQKSGYKNGMPTYDNNLNPEPVFAKKLNYKLEKILW